MGIFTSEYRAGDRFRASLAEVGRVGEQRGRVGPVDLVRAAQEARGDVLLLGGGRTDLGDGGLEVLDRGVALTQRSRVAGPTMVVAVVKGRSRKPIPSAAGTVVQSQPGLAAQALPPAGRLVDGRAVGSRVKVAVFCSAGAVGCSVPSDPR